jgi:hypothetical protein
VDAVTLVRNGFGGGEVVPQPDNYGNAIDPTTMSKPDQKKWVTARLDTNPDEFLDNRQAKRDGFFMTRDGRRFDVKPTTPDYKHKSTGLGVWV